LFDSSTAKLNGNSTAELFDSSTAKLNGNSTAVLYGSSTAELNGNSTAELFDSSTAELFDSSYICSFNTIEHKVSGKAICRYYYQNKIIASKTTTIETY
jgi:hypothetical protein